MLASFLKNIFHYNNNFRSLKKWHIQPALPFKTRASWGLDIIPLIFNIHPEFPPFFLTVVPLKLWSVPQHIFSEFEFFKANGTYLYSIKIYHLSLIMEHHLFDAKGHYKCHELCQAAQHQDLCILPKTSFNHCGKTSLCCFNQARWNFIISFLLIKKMTANVSIVKAFLRVSICS